MNPLERGGAAAALTLERLREAQRRLEPLEFSPETLLVWREEGLLAPLIGWIEAEGALRSAVQVIEGNPGLPQENAAQPPHPAVFPAFPFTERKAAIPDAGPDLRKWPLKSPGESREPVPPVTADKARRRFELAFAGNEHTARGWYQPIVAAPRPAQVITILAAAAEPADRPLLAIPAESGVRGWAVAPPGESREPVPPVTVDEARHRFELAFAGDERTARGWHQPLAAASGSAPVPSVLLPPEIRRPKVIGSPSHDPVSLGLETVVNRALCVRQTSNETERPGPPQLRPLLPAEEALPPAWEAPSTGEPLRRARREPLRASGLRRLASFGADLEPDRVLPLVSPCPAVSEDALPHRNPVPFEGDDLTREVADIFRREALRHGIVPDEEAP